jgi:hypothetical protein
MNYFNKHYNNMKFFFKMMKNKIKLKIKNNFNNFFQKIYLKKFKVIQYNLFVLQIYKMLNHFAKIQNFLNIIKNIVCYLVKANK